MFLKLSFLPDKAWWNTNIRITNCVWSSQLTLSYLYLNLQKHQQDLRFHPRQHLLLQQDWPYLVMNISKSRNIDNLQLKVFVSYCLKVRSAWQAHMLSSYHNKYDVKNVDLFYIFIYVLIVIQEKEIWIDCNLCSIHSMCLAYCP